MISVGKGVMVCVKIDNTVMVIDSDAARDCGKMMRYVATSWPWRLSLLSVTCRLPLFPLTCGHETTVTGSTTVG